MTDKRCTKCKEVKQVSEFNKNKRRKDGIDGWCKSCALVAAKVWYSANKERRKLYDKEYVKINADRRSEQKRVYARVNSVEIVARVAEWGRNNPDRLSRAKNEWYIRNKDAVSCTSRQWKMDNPHKVNANTAHRRARLLSATPEWANTTAIQEIYKHAKENGLHVDHIVPLRSSMVCGLHVENNLRAIEPKQNAIKVNRYWPDMP